MRYILYSALFFCFAAMTSCGMNSAGGPKMEAVKPVPLPAVTPSTGTPTNTNPLPPVAPATTNTTAAKLNPAHGQPGHRCDISVGAPLPGGSAVPAAPKTSAITPVAQNTPAPVTPVAALPAVSPAINPAHGKPGHRCDVAVGAPIPKTSAPAAKTITPAAPVVTPVAQNTPLVQPAAATVATGLNPPHGQPGHRCDVGVGKPLSSAPKK